MVKYRWNHKKRKKRNKMAYVKNYNPGQIKLDLPSANYIYEMPLFIFLGGWITDWINNNIK